MSVLGLTAEETTALCHLVGVGGAAAMVISSIATAWIAFVHNLYATIQVSGWVPSLDLVALVGALIAGGIVNDKYNTPAPKAGQNGEPK